MADGRFRTGLARDQAGAVRLVVALGGNALSGPLRGSDTADIEARLQPIAHDLARLAVEHEVVVTHGNGPQIGHLAAAHASVGDDIPLDVVGAESDGMLGYLIESAINDAASSVGVDRDVVTILTRVIVDAADPAFERPTKPIGPAYDEPAMRGLSSLRNWNFVKVPTQHARGGAPAYRRVVPSPVPRGIRPRRAIAELLGSGHVVICGGGGGIPVTIDAQGRQDGVEAVVDKDLTSTQIAIDVAADALLLLTDVGGVYRNFGRHDARLLSTIDRTIADSLDLAEGSMRPKVDAAIAFEESTHRSAAIGAADQLLAVVAGTAGTHVHHGVDTPRDEKATAKARRQ